MDGSKCISYLTIELKSRIPETFQGQMQDWIFGCDICQEVCPWNRFSTPHHEPAFNPEHTQPQTKNEWIELTEETFDLMFSKTPLTRAGYKKIRETVITVSKRT